MPAKKLKTKNKPAKAVKKLVKAPVKKLVKSPAQKAKAVQKPVKKIAAKKVPAKKVPAKKTVSKKIAAVKKSAIKPVKKIIEKNKKLPAKPLAKTLVKPAKKEVKKPIPLKVKKVKEVKLSKSEKAIKVAKEKISSAKTSARIIAKAKNAGDKVQEKESEVVPEKKSEAQKNLIIVKKLAESRTKITFKINDYAVYPSHGVGKITEIERTRVLGQDFSCYLMYFEKEKLMIKIPVHSAEKIGLRHLVSKSQMDEVFSTLRSGIKKLKGMWSRRAQEYETKINSGDIMLLAEVLRDLTRDIEDGERSYSERIIYETAVQRLAAEYSVIYGIEFEEAKDKIITTAKDKLGFEGKITQKDEFDEFDYDSQDADSEDEDEDEESEDEDEDEDDDYGDDDDDKPKKRKKKK